MRPCCLLLIFLLFTFNYSLAQKHHEDIVLLTEGSTLQRLVYEGLDLEEELQGLDTATSEGRIKNSIYQAQKRTILFKAFSKYKQLIQEYPKSRLRYRALNNIALVSYQLGYIDDAIKYNKQIIDSKAKDKEFGGTGDGLMAEPYANYKNRACKKLAILFLERKNYEEALKYVKLTKKHPYLHFCGNAAIEDEIYVNGLYAKCYKELGEIGKALEYSLPHTFVGHCSSLSYSERVGQVTFDILKENYDVNFLLNEYQRTVNNITLSDDSTAFELTFMGYTASCMLPFEVIQPILHGKPADYSAIRKSIETILYDQPLYKKILALKEEHP